jgi:Zn-dependent protease
MTSTAPLFRALAHAGAVINLFNLIPVWSLDGARGFAALVRWQRLAVSGLGGLALYLTGEGILWLVILVGFAMSFSPRVPSRPNHASLAAFAVLIGSLSWISLMAR